MRNENGTAVSPESVPIYLTTSPLANATNYILKAMKICYGQLSDHVFCLKTAFFCFNYNCF